MLLITESGWPTKKHCKQCALDKSNSQQKWQIEVDQFYNHTCSQTEKKKKQPTHQIDSTASSSDRMRLITTSNTWEWTKQLLYLVNLSGESAGVDASLTRPHPLISVSSQIQTMKLLALTERRQTIRINRQLVPSRLLTEQPRLSRVQGRLIRCRPEINSWLNEGRLGQTPDHTLGFTAS